MSLYACHDCDGTFNAPTDTDTCRCPGCGEMAVKEPAAAQSAPADAERRGRYAAAFGPNMRFGLQDAELVGEPGAERINDWITWITDAAIAVADAEQTTLHDHIRQLHEPVGGMTQGRPFCRTCSDENGEALTAPCATVRALDGAAPAAVQPPAGRATVLREAADVIEADSWSRRDRWGRYEREERETGMCEAADLLRRMADEAQQTDLDERTAQSGVDTPGCDCGHDGMGYGWHPRDCAWRKSRCTCADAGPEFVPAGHYANCPQADKARQARPRQACACGQPGCEYCDADDEAQQAEHTPEPT